MTPLRNELVGSGNDVRVAFRNRNRRLNCQFSAGALLLVKYPRVKISFVVKDEDIERDSNHANGLTPDELDENLGGACTLP